MRRDSWDIRRSIRRHVVLSLIAALLLVGGVGGWAASIELAGAVVAPGSLVVASSVKKVQHPTGGVVGQIRVHEGDMVRTGDVSGNRYGRQADPAPIVRARRRLA